MRWLLALVLFGATVSSASASDYHYAGETNALTNPRVVRMVVVATAFWQARNVPVCTDKLVVRMAPDLNDANGRALDCDIWLRTELVQWADSGGWSTLMNLCYVTMHEMAHTGGLNHEAMAPYESAWLKTCRNAVDYLIKRYWHQRKTD